MDTVLFLEVSREVVNLDIARDGVYLLHSGVERRRNFFPLVVRLFHLAACRHRGNSLTKEESLEANTDSTVHFALYAAWQQKLHGGSRAESLTASLGCPVCSATPPVSRGEWNVLKVVRQ